MITPPYVPHKRFFFKLWNPACFGWFLLPGVMWTISLSFNSWTKIAISCISFLCNHCWWWEIHSPKANPNDYFNLIASIKWSISAAASTLCLLLFRINILGVQSLLLLLCPLSNLPSWIASLLLSSNLSFRWEFGNFQQAQASKPVWEWLVDLLEVIHES